MQSNARDIHKAKMAAKAARNADPAASAAQLAQINAPVLRRLPAVQSVAEALGAKHNLSTAACIAEAARMVEANHKYFAAAKARRSARTYKENGSQETERRARQIEGGQLQITGDVA